MILCIGTTPAAQRVMVFQSLALGQVNRAVSTLDGVAGKSINVVKVLKSLGHEPLAAGLLGGDRGEEIRTVLAERQICTAFVNVPSRTRQCITVLDQSNGTQTELVEEGLPVDGAAYESLRNIIIAQIPNASAVVMSGTIAPGIPLDFYATCTRLANEAGAFSVVDAKGEALELALGQRPSLVKPNRAELASTVGKNLHSEETVLQAIQQLAAYGAQRVVVTSGPAPALAFDGTAAWRIHSPSVPVVNAIGSGDAFTAAVVGRLLQGDDLGVACRWGAAAGAANALTAMPGELRRTDVENLFAQTTAERI
jgi:1-phosphofructokinase family hexose kinase